jgi:hypothetical protein
MAHVNYTIATDPVLGGHTIQLPNDVIHVSFESLLGSST